MTVISVFTHIVDLFFFLFLRKQSCEPESPNILLCGSIETWLFLSPLRTSWFISNKTAAATNPTRSACLVVEAVFEAVGKSG